VRLGRRQLDVLRAAEAGTSRGYHLRQGMMGVSGVEDTYGDDVLERLLDLELIERGQDTGPSSWAVELTELGRSELARLAGGITPG